MRDGKEIYRVVYVGSDGIVLSGENGQVVIPEGVMPLGSDLIVDGLKDGTLTVENGEKKSDKSDAEHGDAGETDVEDGGELDVSDWSDESDESDRLDDVPFQESVRKRSSSLGERDASLKTFDNGKIEQFVKERLETGIEKGEYRVNKKGDKERIIAGAVKAFQMFHDKTITLSDGRVVYFYPDVRSFERNGSDALAWAEYSMHFVTSSGDEIAPKIHERLYSGSKADDIHLIEPIIKEEKVFAKFDDKYPSKDAVVFVGTSSNGKLIEIVTRLDDFGNINANLTEVTAVIKGKKLDNPPHAPLTEVVEAVACHQGAGYSPSTNNNINGFGDLSSAVTQKFDSGNTSRPQIAAGFKKIDFKPSTVNLDLGGGKFDQGTEYLEEKGVTNLIFDPVNRASEHNKKIYEAVKNGGVDTVTCNNVLNVIAESNARSNIILQCAKALKPGDNSISLMIFPVFTGNHQVIF